MVAIRRGRRSDVEEVMSLWDLLTRADAPPPHERWELVGDALEVWRRHLVDHFIKGEGALFVAEEEESGEVVGFVAADARRVSPLFPVGRVGRIDSLFVRPSHQGRGVGRGLVEAAEAWLAGEGYETVEVKTFWSNVASRAMWAHLGYGPSVVTLEKALTSAGREAPRTPGRVPSGSPPGARSAWR